MRYSGCLKQVNARIHMHGDVEDFDGHSEHLYDDVTQHIYVRLLHDEVEATPK